MTQFNDLLAIGDDIEERIRLATVLVRGQMTPEAHADMLDQLFDGFTATAEGEAARSQKSEVLAAVNEAYPYERLVCDEAANAAAYYTAEELRRIIEWTTSDLGQKMNAYGSVHAEDLGRRLAEIQERFMKIAEQIGHKHA